MPFVFSGAAAARRFPEAFEGAYTSSVREEPRFRFGFALTGLLSAALAYFAFGAGLFSGPGWLGFLTAAGIGVASAASMLTLEKAVLRAWGARRPETGSVRITGGDWGCPRCGSAYVREATVCSDCEVPLVESGRG